LGGLPHFLHHLCRLADNALPCAARRYGTQRLYCMFLRCLSLWCLPVTAGSGLSFAFVVVV